MLRHILIILVSYLFVFCSSETDNMISASIASKFGDEDEEVEEEITAVPPTVISGAHLVCFPKFKDENSQTINISCHFEKDGVIIEGIPINETDFEIYNTNGDDLILSSTKNEDGQYIFKVSLTPDTEINISLKSIDGEPLTQDIEVFSDVIDLEEIRQTEKYGQIDSIPKETEIEKNNAAGNKVLEPVEDDGIPLSAPTNVDDGDYTSSRTISPNISWSASTDLEGINSYEVSIGTTAGDENIRSWENVGNVTSKIFDDLDLSSGSIYFVNVRAIDLSGNVSEMSSSDGFIYNYCNALEIPGSWILVPGDADYGTNDFCVMKYEAKNNSGIPSSQSSGIPWVDISQISAKSVCESLGTGFHLITNQEWMTIAANAANIGSNWSSGNVGDGELVRGHSDKSPNQKCAADASDENAYVQDDCSGSASGTFNQRRTHNLSNGGKIWDLSGNIFELVDYYNQNDRPAMPIPSEYAEFTELTPTASFPLRDLIPTNEVKPYWNDAWNSNQSIGQYWGATNGSEGVMLRGGEYDEETAAGLFYAAFDFEPDRTHQDVGFRCTFLKP